MLPKQAKDSKVAYANDKKEEVKVISNQKKELKKKKEISRVNDSSLERKTV